MKIPYRVKETIKHIRLSSYIKQKKIDVISDRRIAIIDMRSVIPDRRAIQIAVQLEESGFDTYLYCPNYFSWMRASFLHTWRYSDSLLNKGIIKKISRKPDVCIVGNLKNSYEAKCIIVNDSIMDNITMYTNKEFFYPILMHPSKLGKKIEFKCNETTIENRKIGILFVGNINEQYSIHANNIHEKYGIMARSEVIDFIKKYCKEILYSPDTYEEFISEWKNGNLENQIVIIDKFRLTDDYLEILKSARFFLYTAGVEIPYCHNQIESTACGCIPITEFAHYYAGLENKKNCFTYSSKEELGELCLSLCQGRKCNTEQMEKMSVATMQWYNANCSFLSFERKLNAFLSSDKQTEEYCIFREISPVLRKIEKITGFHF